MGVNGIAAANRLRGFRDIEHGMCLFYVWQAYKAEGARAEGSYGTALAGWHGSPGKHEGDWNPPAGVPVWFGAKPSSIAGDVVISLGGGIVVATDYPRYGVVGICTIEERQRQIGRPYLGWTETILGAPIDLPQPTTNPTPATPATPIATPDSEEEIMKPFVVMLPEKRWALVLPQGNGKPKAVTLQGNAGARAVALYGEPIPFDEAVSRDSLATAVDGI